MWLHDRNKEKSFLPVAMAFILVGAIIFTFGIIAWLFNLTLGFNQIATPSGKIIGGLIVMALGYIQLELGLTRGR